MSAIFVLLEMVTGYHGFITGSFPWLTSIAASFLCLMAVPYFLYRKYPEEFCYKKKEIHRLMIVIFMDLFDGFVAWVVAGNITITGLFLYTIFGIMCRINLRNTINQNMCTLLVSFSEYRNLSIYGKCSVACYDDNVELFKLLAPTLSKYDFTMCTVKVLSEVVERNSNTEMSRYMFKNYYAGFSSLISAFEELECRHTELVIELNPCYQLLKYNVLPQDLVRMMNKFLY